MPAELGKILVVRGGAIGDFILTLPVLSALRANFPEVKVELLAYPRVAPLALAGGLVHRTQSIDARPLASFFARGGVLPSALGDYFGSFAVVISYLFDPDRIFQENVARCSKAQFIVGPHRPDQHGRIHAADAFLKPLTRLAIFDPDPIPRLCLNPEGTRADLDLELEGTDPDNELPRPPNRAPWLALHPGSGSERKNWPANRWNEFVFRLTDETDLNFLLVGGEAEGDRLQRLAALVPKHRIRVAANLPLTDLAQLLQQCAGYVGHDSGISHLAAALGLRALLLWGETPVEVWRPRNPGVQLLSAHSGLEALEVGDVLKALRSHLEIPTVP